MNNVHSSLIHSNELPLIIKPHNTNQGCATDLANRLTHENTDFKQLLIEHKAILFRGFNIRSTDDFSAIIKAYALGEMFNYDQCAVPRTKLQEGIYTSVDGPGDDDIPMHNEKSYDPEFPSHIYLNCITPAKIGGNTPIIDAHQLWRSLPDALQKKFITHGILYRQFYFGTGIKQKLTQIISKGAHHNTWMHAFQTKRKHDVELCLNNINRQFQWHPNGNALITEHLLPACQYHPITGKIVWFNQSAHYNYYYNNSAYAILNTIKNPLARLVLSSKHFLPYFAQRVAFFGNGEPISRQEADIIHCAIQQHKRSVPWQQGDVMVVDNYACLHGKDPHKGERLVLAGMTA